MNVFDLVAKIALDTTEYNRSLDDSEKRFRGFGDKLSGLGDGIKSGISTLGKIGAAAIGAATTAIAGFAASSVKTGMAFDAAMSKVAATMGKSVDEIQDLRDFAQEMGASTAFSATQAAEALNYMALAGYQAEDSMKMLPTVLNLAAAGGMDLARASDMVTDAQSALGLTMDETSEFVNKMAVASSTTNTSVEQLGDAILTIGGTAKQLSGGTTELSQALGLLADNGIKGAEGGTALRNILLNLTPKSKEAAEAMEGLGFSAYDADGKMRPLKDIFMDLNASMAGMSDLEKSNALSAMFNKVDLKSVNALLGTSAERWDQVAAAIDNAGDAASNMADTQLNNLQGALTIMKSAFEGLQIAVSDKLTPSLVDFVKFGAEGLSEMTKAFKDGGLSGAMDALGKILSDGLALVIGKIPMFVDAGMQLLGALGKGIIDNLPTLADAAIQIVQMISGKLSASGPQILAAAGQVGTQFIEWLGNTISTNGPNLMTKFMELATNFANWLITGITENLPTLIETGMNMLVQFTEAMRNGSGSMMSIGLDLVTAIAQAIIDNIPVFFETIPTIISNIAGMIMDNAPQLLETAVNVGSQFIQTIGQAITDHGPELISNFVEMASNFVEWLSSGISENLPSLIETGMNMLMELSGSLREGAGQLVDVGLKLITTIASALIDNLPVFIQTVPTIVSNIAGIINDNAPKLLVTGLRLLAQLALGLIQAIPTIVMEIPKIIKAIVDVFFAFNWINLGGSIITGIKNGIAALSESVPTTLHEIGLKAVEIVKGIDWAHLGKSLIELILTGIKAMLTAIPNLLKSIGELAVDAITSIDWIAVGTAIISGIITGIKSLAKAAVNAVKNVGKSMASGAEDELEIHSPSKKFAYIGQMADEGIVGGVEAGLPKVMSAMRNLTGAMLDGGSVMVSAATPDAAMGAEGSGFQQQVISLLRQILDEGIHNDVTLQGDAASIFRTVRRENGVFTRATGYSAI